MNLVEMYIRVFIVKVDGFIRRNIVAKDPYQDYSVLDYEDRRHN